jgi:hypothetical protein
MNQREIQEILTRIYGIAFPDEIFAFWDFAESAPPDTFRGLDGPLYMSLGEIFDIFKPDFKYESYKPHWDSRYYTDPPEFFTVLHGHVDGEHWGYYLENPVQPSWFVASYYSHDSFEFSISDNLFTAVRKELEYHFIDCGSYLKDDPQNAASYQATLEALTLLREHLMRYATQDRLEQGDAYIDKYNALERTLNWTAQTRNWLGISAPKELYKVIPGIDPFTIASDTPSREEVEHYERAALQALAEGYPATALKLGKELWIYRNYFETTFRLLDTAYEALNWTLNRNLLRQAKARREDYDAKRR